jgi:hypothetical protein
LAAKPIYDRGAAKRRLAERYHDDNLLAAQLILKSPEKHGSVGSLPVTWAQSILRSKRQRDAAWGLVA